MIEGQSQYVCEREECEYYTKHSNCIKTHINDKHLNAAHFKCVELNCGQIFKTYSSLNEHLNHHLCVYGIKSLEKNGICNDENLNTFYG